MDEEFKQRVLQQVIDFWIIPEVEKRRNLNRLPRDFKLRSAQIIFSLERGWNKVRLNEEVKAIAKSKVNRSIKKGDTVYENDIDNIKKIELTDDDKNCAHITLLLFKNSWVVSFDFKYNKNRVKEHIEASKEFYESSKDNLDKNRLRPFFECAFASAELSAKAILLTLPDKNILYGKNHEDRINQFKNWTELGNVPKKHSETLTRLNSLRPSARYLCSTEFKKENPNAIIQTLGEMIEFAEKNIDGI